MIHSLDIDTLIYSNASLLFIYYENIETVSEWS